MHHCRLWNGYSRVPSILVPASLTVDCPKWLYNREPGLLSGIQEWILFVCRVDPFVCLGLILWSVAHCYGRSVGHPIEWIYAVLRSVPPLFWSHLWEVLLLFHTSNRKV